MEPTAAGKCAGDNLILEKDVSLLLCRRRVVHQGNAFFFSSAFDCDTAACQGNSEHERCLTNLDTFRATLS
jgi:hypothetical protein